MAEGEVGAHNCPDTKTGRRVRMQCLRMVYTGVTRSGIFVGADGKKNACTYQSDELTHAEAAHSWPWRDRHSGPPVGR